MIRGAVYKVDFGQQVRGHLQRGKRFAVVISNAPERWTVATVIPTSRSAQEANFRPVAEVEGQKTRLLVDQMVTMNVDDIGDLVGYLSPEELAEAEEAVTRYLRLGGMA